MNIFFLDKNPSLAAQYHHDVHLNKMILETAQLLSTAHHVLDGSLAPTGIYKATHLNHPSAIWIRECSANYDWLFDLFLNLEDEFWYRKDKSHATGKLAGLLALSPQNIKYTGRNLTLPPMCMPDEYKTSGFCWDDVVEAYRRYYNGRKLYDKNGKFIGTYTKREKPSWLRYASRNRPSFVQSARIRRG